MGTRHLTGFCETDEDTKMDKFKILKTLDRRVDLDTQNLSDCDALIERLDCYGFFGSATLIRRWTERMHYHIEREFSHGLTRTEA